jgi:hypothetical protein
MKYIKTFEWNEQLYNIGDIVKLDIKKILYFNKTKGYTPETNVSMFPAHSVGEITRYYFDLEYPYRLEFYDGSIFFDTCNEEILGKASPEEIKEFLLIKNLSKFNI